MKFATIALATLSLVAFSAHADDADPSGQFANTVAAKATRAEVQAQLADYRSSGVNPWSTSYNPLKSFQSVATREQVRADYVAHRNAVAAMTREDSGSSYLAAARRATVVAPTLAGQPVNAQ
jgi:hypothetical protein